MVCEREYKPFAAIKTINKNILYDTPVQVALSSHQPSRPPRTYPASCRKIKHPDTVHVRFHIDSIYNNKPPRPFLGKFYKGRPKRLTALNVCNKLLDRAPKAVVNSGASHNFATVDYNGGKHQDVKNGIQVRVANHDIITSTATDEFPFENVPANARVCQKFPHLANHLSSVGKMCDANMLLLFDMNYVYIFNRTGKEILRSQRHPLTKLYMIPFLRDVTTANVQRVPHGSNLAKRVSHVTRSINNGHEIKPVAPLISYLHRVAISIHISQWCEAVGKDLTARGHMRLVQLNVRPTRLKPLKK